MGREFVASLQEWVGLAEPRIVAVAHAGLQLEVDLTAVERMGCSFRELRLRVPELENRSFDGLKQWADAFCERVTYLLEPLAPLEVDREAGQILVRSAPPARQPEGTKYYELRLQASGVLALRRYRVLAGQPGRDQIEMHATHEMAEKLIDDLARVTDAPC